MYGFISGLYSLVCMSAPVLVTVALSEVLKSGSVNTPALLFFFKIVLAFGSLAFPCEF